MIRAITFHIVTCDVCGDEDTDEVLPLFDTPQIAADNARRCGWLVTADQRTICPDTNHRHRAAIDQLMPPSPAPRSTASCPSTPTRPTSRPSPGRAATPLAPGSRCHEGKFW
ncbi:hypothetical protein ACFVVX_01115 [Kitasatospora sp. NPDC058170]|uniref:hypothetical protein n=1 Tax=Kitasatospora sp. NPDC058170 TaxID=3346364 RepID=UPI0036DE8050